MLRKSNTPFYRGAERDALPLLQHQRAILSNGGASSESVALFSESPYFRSLFSHDIFANERVPRLPRDALRKMHSRFVASGTRVNRHGEVEFTVVKTGLEVRDNVETFVYEAQDQLERYYHSFKPFLSDFRRTCPFCVSIQDKNMYIRLSLDESALGADSDAISVTEPEGKPQMLFATKCVAEALPSKNRSVAAPYETWLQKTEAGEASLLKFGDVVVECLPPAQSVHARRLKSVALWHRQAQHQAALDLGKGIKVALTASAPCVHILVNDCSVHIENRVNLRFYFACEKRGYG